MILYPPVSFDQNEWFILFATLVSWLTLWSIRRSFSFIMFITIWMLNCTLAFTADFTIGIPPIDLYDFNDRPQYEWFDVILYMLTYPPSQFVMLYGYERWKPHGWLLFAYLTLFAAITTGLEAIAAYGFHVFTYHNWRLAYSFPTYIGIYGLNLLTYRFIRKHAELTIRSE